MGRWSSCRTTVGGRCATLAIGTVGPGRTPETVRSTHISYFARLCDVATFTELAAGEETAGTVAGVVDGATWR